MAKSPAKASPKSQDREEEDLLSLCRALPAFKGLTIEVLTGLLDSATEKLVLQGDFIFRENDRGSTLVIFTKGLAVELKRSGNTDCLLNYYNEPAVLGESSFLESNLRTTSLYANDDCWITEIDGSQLKELHAKSPSQAQLLTSNLGREIGKKVSAINSKLDQANQVSFIRDLPLAWLNY